MEKFFLMLKDIKKNPYIFIGEKSVKLLHAYILGYIGRDIDNSYDIWEVLNGFQVYISKRYGLNTTHSWSSIIRFFSTTDEESFDLFYKHFEEYLRTLEMCERIKRKEENED